MKKLFLTSVLFLGLFAGPFVLPADSTILFQGGEHPDFSCTGTCQAVTAAGNFRSNYARIGYQVSAGSSADPPSNRFSTTSFSGVSDIWAHFWVTATNSNTTSSNQFIRFMDSVGNPAVIIRGVTGTGLVKISSRTSAGVFTDLTTCASQVYQVVNDVEQWDVHLVFASSGGGGAVTIYVNGISMCSYSGTTTNGDGSTTITAVEFSSPSSNPAPMSEVIVADADTRSMSRFTMNTLTSGNTTAWTNSSGTTPCSTSILAQIAQNDANYVQTGASGNVELCAPNKSIPSGNWTVKTLGFSMRALRGAGGPQNISYQIRESSTNYTLSPTIAPSTSFGKLQNFLQMTDPATSSAWTVSALTDANFQIGFKSEP